MNIENQIKDVISKQLEEGLVERLVAENLEKGINKALESLLGSYGDITKVIEKNIKDVMLEQLSSYNYSNYVVKLDTVLTEILKNTALDHKKMLENFKNLMAQEEIPKTIKVSELFDKYIEHVAKNVSTSDLEVVYNDGVSYENVIVTMEIEEEEGRSWSSFKHAKIFFECEKDDDMNVEISLSKWSDRPWELSGNFVATIQSLRYISDFQLYLMKLQQANVKIDFDTYHDEEEVTPEKEPEPDYR